MTTILKNIIKLKNVLTIWVVSIIKGNVEYDGFLTILIYIV